MYKADVLLGLQWGDEGKGKIVDVLTPGYDIIARFQGGPNAGHTLEFNGIKHVLHTIPSGIFHPTAINIVGNGVVIDPVIFKKEIDSLSKLGVDVAKKLIISKRAHLILPTHRLLDAASEASKGKNKIGSTLKGIGPTYMDKTGRNGLRIGDIETKEFREKYEALVEKHKQLLSFYNFEYNLKELEPVWFEAIESLKTSAFIIMSSVTPFTITAYFNAGISSQPVRRGRPVVLPNSFPICRIFSPVALSSSVGKGPLPTRVQ